MKKKLNVMNQRLKVLEWIILIVFLILMYFLINIIFIKKSFYQEDELIAVDAEVEAAPVEPDIPEKNQKAEEPEEEISFADFDGEMTDEEECGEEAEAPAEAAGTKIPEMPPIRRERRDIAPQSESIFAGEEETDGEEITFDLDDEEFEPLETDDSDPSEMAWEKFEPKVERKPPVIGGRDDEAVKLNGRAPRLKSREERPAATGDIRRKPAPVKAARKARTYVPPKVMDPDDMFMDSEDEFDEYDDLDMEYADLPDDEFEYEEDEESSFFFRHIRGIMGFSLLALLAVVCMIYVFSHTGQVALAKMNLAWNPDVYSKVAYEYYESGLYDMSGSFYEKALSRDEDNYNYAISAASAYIYAGNTEKAASMLKKSIAINPAKADPYIYLLSIYPDPATRPWDVSQLLQQGYGRTGDDRLKSVAQ